MATSPPPKPNEFKRGSTFSFAFDMPEAIADGFFLSWVPTAQIRKAGNDMPSGLIADLACFWADPKTTRRLVMYHNLSGKWPLGLAEVDVLFTSSNGATIRSSTIPFNITRGITK